MAERCTVLVIDDDSLVRMTLVAYLEDSGYSVIEAADGEEGVELFRKLLPDIVLTDLRMPKLDGFGVIAAIQTLSPRTPVVAITGTGDPAAATEALRLGARGFLTKPIIDFSELEASIERALAAVAQ